jgi:hypothetical protein
MAENKAYLAFEELITLGVPVVRCWMGTAVFFQ